MCCFILKSVKFILVFTIVIECNSDNFRQEAAKVIYSNPKYVQKVSVLTYRLKRQSPYVTSCNVTTLVPVENNVTIIIDCWNAKLKTEIFSIDFKTCDAVKMTWLKDWLKSFSNFPTSCPVPANSYYFKDFDIPPKNFPIPLPSGDYYGHINFVHTNTREKFLEIKMNLRFENKKLG